MSPMKKVINERIGRARTPTSMACDSARLKRSGLPRKGPTTVKYAARPVRDAREPRYVRPEVTASPISATCSIASRPTDLLGEQCLLLVLVNLKNVQEP